MRLLLPVFEINLVYLKAACRSGRSSFERLDVRQWLPLTANKYVNAEALLHDEWFRLRRILEDFLDGSDALRRFAQTQGTSADLEDEVFAPFQVESRTVTEEARRLEAEICDYMQYQVGSMALEESKRSIQTSSVRLQEAQRSMPPIPAFCSSH